MFTRFVSKARFSTSSKPTVEKYNGAMQFFHWAAGGSILACLGLIQYKQSLPVKTDEEKAVVGNIMMYHKSFGLVVSGLYFPRLLTALASKHPV